MNADIYLNPTLGDQRGQTGGKPTHVRQKFTIGKRQRFIASVFFLSAGLFISEFLFTNIGIIVAFFLGILSDVFFFLSMHQKGMEKPYKQTYILPFLYSLSFGLFYLLAPSRIITRIIMTSLYALGLYSLYLSENIFTIASIRTIALLNGARIVSFVITLVSYFFLVDTIFSFRIGIIPTGILIFICSFFFTLFSIWTYTLERAIFKNILWVFVVSFSLIQISTILWFWPTSPTVVSLYLTCVLYILVGLIHIWLDKRFFKGVLWEYIWVSVLASLILIIFTNWQG